MTKLLLLGILFSTAVNAEIVANTRYLIFYFVNFSIVVCSLTSPLASEIFFFNFDLSVSYLVFKTNSLVSILFTFATNLSYTVFLPTSFFTTLLSLLKLTGTGPNSSISNLSISALKLAISAFAASLGGSIPAAFYKSAFVA